MHRLNNKIFYKNVPHNKTDETWQLSIRNRSISELSSNINSISFRDLNPVRKTMTTTPGRVQVPGLNLQQEIGSSIHYTSATSTQNPDVVRRCRCGSTCLGNG
ncbi:hypothetical protein OUZ56_032913 [Daphnia magna]|uniref:Uncharacterized protein n=1 Tax=Daphnia magna TaxID=35525 RepID=A0ABQ9ZXW1_9CRUS|nr:hypothetical protein OUZ56_032913 [Daphnia magna]